MERGASLFFRKMFARTTAMPLRRGLDTLIHRLRRAAAAPAEGAPDASLLERFVAGRDEAAFELLLWRHGPMVLSVCRRMLRCDQDAEDAFQAAFLLLARKASGIRRGQAVAGWLYQTACRIALRARHTMRKQPVAVPPGLDPAAPRDDADMVWRDLRPVLDEEVRRLPEKYRLPIILCYFQGRTQAEAAAVLGCPGGTVAGRLHRARELLRGRLTRRGLALSATALAVLAATRTACATVPPALVHTSLKAALLFAAGKTIAGVVSVRAAAWTQGVLRTMLFSKLKMLAAVVLLVGAVGTGTGLLMSVTAAAPATPPKPPAVGQADDGKATVEVPAEREGRLVLVGTDVKGGDKIPAKDKVTIPIGFLAVEVGDRNDPKNKNLAVEKWWAALDPTGTNTSEGTTAYARWKEGDALPVGKLVIAHEERVYRKLHIGDAVEEGQLLALVDQAPALEELQTMIEAQASAEQDHAAAVKTKEEAIRRAQSSTLLHDKGLGYISEDDYQAALLNRDRYIEEVKVKILAGRRADRAILAAVRTLKLCEIRSADRGVVKEILKRRGEAIHNLEAVVRLEVQDAVAPPARPAVAPSASLLNVPSRRDGVLLAMGTEVKEGEKVPADRLVTITVEGQVRKYRRLREGDTVEEGQLLAVLDDRLARLDVEVGKDKLDAAEAQLAAAGKVREEAAFRDKRMSELSNKGAVSEQEVSVARLDRERATGDEKVRMAAVRQAQAELKAAMTILEMYEVRSPVRGVVRSIARERGEAVKSLETVVQIEEKEKEKE